MADNEQLSREIVIQRQGSFNFGARIVAAKIEAGYLGDDVETEEELDQKIKSEINKWASNYRNAANSRNGQIR